MPACEKGHGSNRSAGHAQQHWPPIDGFSRNFRDLQPVQKASEGSQFLQQTSDRLSLTSGFFEQPQSLAAVVEAGGNLAVLPNLGTDRVDRKPTADLFQKNPVGMANGVSVFGPILVIGKYDEAIVLVLRRSSVPQEQTSRKDDPPGPGDPQESLVAEHAAVENNRLPVRKRLTREAGQGLGHVSRLVVAHDDACGRRSEGRVPRDVQGTL